MVYDPNVRYVDLYVNGVWKALIHLEKKISGQQDNHSSYVWEVIGLKWSYDKRPPDSEIAGLQLGIKLPKTLEENIDRYDI